MIQFLLSYNANEIQVDAGLYRYGDVNQDAVREDAKGNAYVYEMDVDGFYKVKYVETSALVGNMIIIKSGLEGGEEVVVR